MTDSKDPSESKVNCPVCLTHTKDDSLGAQGMVLTAAAALVKGDDKSITAAAENSEPYDFHMAVTMYVETLCFVAETLGYDVEELIKDLRQQLDSAIQRAGS